jgi:multisubunit Na+/H+ antiporter MnhB subunit
LPFVLFGSVAIVLSLLGRGERSRRLAVTILVGWAVCVAVLALAALPSVPRHWIAVDASAATQMAKVE